MGNALQCNEVLCSENIYELEWINEKNWLIESLNEKNKPNNESYKIINGNFKIFNKSLHNYKLIKKNRKYKWNWKNIYSFFIKL